MSENMVLSIMKDGVVTALMVAAPIILISLLVGLIISIFQATTQIQEQTLTFVPKLIAAAAVGLFTGAWMLNTVVSFTERIFTIITNVTK